MKTVFPDYYKDFRCIASQCPDTCCAGWDIVVDDGSIKKYDSLGGGIGAKIRSKMCRDNDGDVIFKNENGRCPFLTRQNLCEIYTAAGKDHLCKTCAMFPRFSYDFGSVREKGLGLACPEAAKIILSRRGGFDLMSSIDSAPPDPNDIDARYYLDLIRIRSDIFSLLDREDITVRKRLELIAEKYIKSDKKSIVTDPFDLLGDLEILTDDWRRVIAGADDLNKADYGFEYKNIADYYIYRYLLSSVFDGDHVTKIKFCIFSCAVINRVSGSLGILRAAQLYSKEIEYSADNISALFARLKQTGADSIISFL